MCSINSRLPELAMTMDGAVRLREERRVERMKKQLRGIGARAGGSWREGKGREATGGLGQGFLKGRVLCWMGTELPFIGRARQWWSDGRTMQAGLAFIARLSCSLRRETTDNWGETVRTSSGHVKVFSRSNTRSIVIHIYLWCHKMYKLQGTNSQFKTLHVQNFLDL
jgi:hypothetical protein